MISIRWKFQFFFFFFSHARRREEGRGEPIARIPSVSSFSRTVPSSPPSYLFSPQWSSLRFRFHVSISQQVSSFHLDGDLSFLFIFSSSSSSSLSSSYRNANDFEWITDNEIITNEEEEENLRENRREDVSTNFDEFTRESTRLFSLEKFPWNSREFIPEERSFWRRIGYVKTWISRSRTTTIRFLFACFFRRTSVVLFFPFLFKEVISPDDKLSERRNSRIQRSSTPLKKKRRKRRKREIFPSYSTLLNIESDRTRRKKRWKKNVFVKYGRKGTIPVFLGWWKVSSTMTETSPGDEEKLGRSLFHRSCIRTSPGEKSGGKCVYHSKLLIPNEWMKRRKENIVRFWGKKKRERRFDFNVMDSPWN